MNCENSTLLVVTVNNHAGVMSHVVGLFSRRAYNLEAILVLPISGTDQSRIWLMVNEEERLEQVIAQVEKLEDVIEIHREEDGDNVFCKINEIALGDRVGA